MRSSVLEKAILREARTDHDPDKNTYRTSLRRRADHRGGDVCRDPVCGLGLRFRSGARRALVSNWRDALLLPLALV